MTLKHIRTIFTGALGLVALLWAALDPPTTHAQAYVLRTDSFLTNTTVKVTNASTLTLNGPGVLLSQGKGIAIWPTLATTNTAGVDNVTFTFQASPDGTNYSTTSAFAYAVPLNGTTAVIGYTNWGSPMLANAKYLRLQKIVTAGTNSLWVSNIVWTIANP